MRWSGQGHTDKICEIREICGTKWRVSKKNTDDTDDTDSQDRGLTDKICEIRGTRKKREKPHPRPLSKGRGEVVSLEGAIVRTGLYRKSVKSVKSVGQEWRGKKPHPRPLSKGRGEVVSLEDAIVRTGLYRQNL